MNYKYLLILSMVLWILSFYLCYKKIRVLQEFQRREPFRELEIEPIQELEMKLFPELKMKSFTEFQQIEPYQESEIEPSPEPSMVSLIKYKKEEDINMDIITNRLGINEPGISRIILDYKIELEDGEKIDIFNGDYHKTALHIFNTQDKSNFDFFERHSDKIRWNEFNNMNLRDLTECKIIKPYIDWHAILILNPYRMSIYYRILYDILDLKKCYAAGRGFKIYVNDLNYLHNKIDMYQVLKHQKDDCSIDLIIKYDNIIKQIELEDENQN